VIAYVQYEWLSMAAACLLRLKPLRRGKEHGAGQPPGVGSFTPAPDVPEDLGQVHLARERDAEDIAVAVRQLLRLGVRPVVLADVGAWRKLGRRTAGRFFRIARLTERAGGRRGSGVVLYDKRSSGVGTYARAALSFGCPTWMVS
jgi:hypothetical protein